MQQPKHRLAARFFFITGSALVAWPFLLYYILLGLSLGPTHTYFLSSPFLHAVAKFAASNSAQSLFAPSLTTGVLFLILGAIERYKSFEEAAVSAFEPFTVDPALVERVWRGHATTQNQLAHYLRSRGLDPHSPRPGEPNFDVAWIEGDSLSVAEIKSLTSSHEESQLRFALGQVLRHRYHLKYIYKNMQIRAVLVVERKPADQSWVDLCQSLDILLVWPAVFSNLEATYGRK